MENQYTVAVNRMALDGKLPAGDGRWGTFNGSFDNQALNPTDLANQIYLGHAYTSWHRPAYRQSDNWECSQFIAVDMDTGDQRSSLTALADHDFVMTYGGLIHTTPSHTPEHPRARAIFFLNRPIDNPKAYTNACKFVSSLLGGDKVATDPSRFFYGNLNCEIELLGGCLNVDYLYALYKRAHPQIKQQAGTRRHNETAVRHRYPYDNANEDKRQVISDALDRIDPWNLEYQEWVSVIAALKFELGEEGFLIAERWANGKEGEIEKMWRSFRRQGGHIARIPTIIALAKRAGA